MQGVRSRRNFVGGFNRNVRASCDSGAMDDKHYRRAKTAHYQSLAPFRQLKAGREVASRGMHLGIRDNDPGRRHLPDPGGFAREGCPCK